MNILQSIKFRAFHINKKEMHQVSAIDFQNSGIQINNPLMHWLPFEEIILMQWTGMIAKINNKEIYEGDVLKIYPYYQDDKNYFILQGVVIRYRNKFSLQVASVINLSAYQQFKNVELVGNIYENPELKIITLNSGEFSFKELMPEIYNQS